MGIKNINKALNEMSPDAFISLSIKHFTGKRIAIDANNLMYTVLYKARSNTIDKNDILKDMNKEIFRNWVSESIELVSLFLANGITPVFVFDGSSLPEKYEEQETRKKNNLRQKERIAEKLEGYKDNLFSVHEVKKAMVNDMRISKEEMSILMDIFILLGIPCLVAKGESEKLCSMMCREGKVYAVYSNDTDNYVYGCPLLITGRNNKRKIIHFDCVRHDVLLEGTQLSQARFIDWCIMCKCDYNSNIPGVGVKRAFDLINKFGNIDKLEMDTSILNHVVCRRLFSFVPSHALVESGSIDKLDIDIDEAAFEEAKKTIKEKKIEFDEMCLDYAYNNIREIYQAQHDGEFINDNYEELGIAVCPDYRSTVVILV